MVALKISLCMLGARGRTTVLPYVKESINPRFNFASCKCNVKPGLLRSQAPRSPNQVLTEMYVA